MDTNKLDPSLRVPYLAHYVRLAFSLQIKKAGGSIFWLIDAQETTDQSTERDTQKLNSKRAI